MSDRINSNFNLGGISSRRNGSVGSRNTFERRESGNARSTFRREGSGNARNVFNRNPARDVAGRSVFDRNRSESAILNNPREHDDDTARSVFSPRGNNNDLGSYSSLGHNNDRDINTDAEDPGLRFLD